MKLELTETEAQMLADGIVPQSVRGRICPPLTNEERFSLPWDRCGEGERSFIRHDGPLSPEAIEDRCDLMHAAPELAELLSRFAGSRCADGWNAAELLKRIGWRRE